MLRAIFFSLVLGVASKAKEFYLQQDDNCHPSCQICFSEAPNICYECIAPRYYSLELFSSENQFNMLFDAITQSCRTYKPREISGYGRSCVECPARTYPDILDNNQCRNCPFECEQCHYDNYHGQVACDKCKPHMGDLEATNSLHQIPLDSNGLKYCKCSNTLFKGECLCYEKNQMFDETTKSCRECGPCDTGKLGCRPYGECLGHQYFDGDSQCCKECHETCGSCHDIYYDDSDDELSFACDTCRMDKNGTLLYTGENDSSTPLLVGDKRYCLCPCGTHWVAKNIGWKCSYNE